MFYDENEPAPTTAEIVSFETGIKGSENSNKAWILSNYDTWERNPYYVGEPVPHPEDSPYCATVEEEEELYDWQKEENELRKDPEWVKAEKEEEEAWYRQLEEEAKQIPF